MGSEHNDLALTTPLNGHGQTEPRPTVPKPAANGTSGTTIVWRDGRWTHSWGRSEKQQEMAIFRFPVEDALRGTAPETEKSSELPPRATNGTLDKRILRELETLNGEIRRLRLELHAVRQAQEVSPAEPIVPDDLSTLEPPGAAFYPVIRVLAILVTVAACIGFIFYLT